MFAIVRTSRANADGQSVTVQESRYANRLERVQAEGVSLRDEVHAQ
jgi:hypothetical protein